MVEALAYVIVFTILHPILAIILLFALCIIYQLLKSKITGKFI